ncbi:hypothetical protein L195_g012388, partial [Trifolium pratense]
DHTLAYCHTGRNIGVVISRCIFGRFGGGKTRNFETILRSRCSSLSELQPARDLLSNWCHVRTTARNTPTSGRGSAATKWKKPDVGGR